MYVCDYSHKIQKQVFFVIEQGETKDNKNKKIDNSHRQFFLVKRVKNYVIMIKLLQPFFPFIKKCF